MPIAKLRYDVNGEVASSGQWARLTKSAEHFLNDGCNVPSNVDPSVIGKAQVIAECAQPVASIANVALTHKG